MNLLNETVEILNAYGRNEEDILWVGGDDFYITWENFKEVADVEYYHDVCGGQEVATDLVIVGKDFWLERRDFEVYESWEFREFPTKPLMMAKVKALTNERANELNDEHGYSWRNLNELNGIIK